jgi:hypothetical protein
MSDRLDDRVRVPQLYLELVKSTVLNTIYHDGPHTLDGSKHPGFETALTMVGRRRLDNTQQLLQAIIANVIPGDIIETGVWRGGSALFAAAVLQVVLSNLAPTLTASQTGLWRAWSPEAQSVACGFIQGGTTTSCPL